MNHKSFIIDCPSQSTDCINESGTLKPTNGLSNFASFENSIARTTKLAVRMSIEQAKQMRNKLSEIIVRTLNEVAIGDLVDRVYSNT